MWLLNANKYTCVLSVDFFPYSHFAKELFILLN